MVDKKLPKGWAWVRFEDVCDIISGKNQSKVINPNGKYPIYGSSGVFGFADEYLCEEGTTIIGRKGTINKPLFVNTKFWNVDTAFGLSTNENYDSKLLYYFCLSFNFQKLDKSTTIPSLAKRDLLVIDIPLPPISTQQAIVSKIEELFSELDKGIENLKTAQAQLKVYRQSVLKWAFEGKLTSLNPDSFDLPDEHDLAMVAEPQEVYANDKHQGNQGNPKNQGADKAGLPEGWKWVTIEDIATVGTGATPLKSNKSYYEGGKFAWVTSGALNDEYVKVATDYVTDKALKETNLSIYPKNTLLLAMYGEGKTRGKCSELLIEASTNQAIAAIHFEKHDNKVKPYLKYFLHKNYNEMRMLSSGGVQPNLNLGIVKRTLLPLPPTTKEQNQIVQEIESRLSVADKMEETIQQSLLQAESLRQSILKKAFEGELVK